MTRCSAVDTGGALPDHLVTLLEQRLALKALETDQITRSGSRRG
jgi:hypothetical protein